MTSRRVRSMDELLPLIPALYGDDPLGLGLVLILRGGEVHACVRWDPKAAEGTLGEVLRACRLEARDHAIAIGYRCEPGEFDAESAAIEIARHVELDHVLVVTESHWWAHLCAPGCCDGAMHARPEIAPEPELRPKPRPSRACGGFDAPRDLPGAEQVRGAWWRLVDAGVTHGADLAADLAVVASALHVPHLRDEVTWTIVPELGCRLGGPAMSSRPAVPTPVLRRLRNAAGVAERPYCDAFLALAAWRCGDMKEARRAVGRAMQDAHNPLARLVDELLTHGLEYEVCVRRLAS